MTTSGTYTFDPALAEIAVNAFGRIQLRRPELLQSHLQDAMMEANFLQARFNDLQPNLWTVDLQTQVLVQSTATYTVPVDTALILDAYISYGTPTTDRIISPISRTEYASYPNKANEGFPSVFWFDRLTAPTITLWLVPDGNGPYTLYYYRVRRIQDAVMAGGATVEVPFLWLDAYTAALAHRLARIYRPDLEQVRKADADEAWQLAAGQDVENVPLYIAPGLAGYWR